MVRADVITLIKYDTHGVFDEAQKTRRNVFCEIASVTRSEFYAARQYNLNPQYVFILSDYGEYQGESQCEWQGRRYDIIRTYINGLKVELTVEESKHD